MQMTGQEFARLAHTAKGFGPGGAYTLVEWINFQVASLMVLDSINAVQATIGDMQTTLSRHATPSR